MKKQSYRLLFLLLAVLAGVGQARADDGNKKGDANGDEVIDVTDASVVTDKFHNTAEPSCPLNSDANGDGVIDVTDVSIILDLFHFGSVDGQGTISGWTEGNSGDELQPQEVTEDEGD